MQPSFDISARKKQPIANKGMNEEGRRTNPHPLCSCIHRNAEPFSKYFRIKRKVKRTNRKVQSSSALFMLATTSVWMGWAMKIREATKVMTSPAELSLVGRNDRSSPRLYSWGLLRSARNDSS